MLFIDTSNVEEIKRFMALKIVKGITTNQKLLLKDGHADVKQTISDLIAVSDGYPINIELTKTAMTDYDLINEAAEYFDMSHQLVIKVPMWASGRGLRIAKSLREAKVPVNMTCCMSVGQVIMASLIHAEYVSLFLNRIADYYVAEGHEQEQGYDLALKTVASSHDFLAKNTHNTKLIVGSIRKPDDVSDALLCGVDIVTVPPEILAKMCLHPKTESTIREFDQAWEELRGKTQ